MLYVERLINNFWKRWSTSYLNELSQYHFQVRGQSKKVEKVPKLNELVLMKDDNIPRNQWRLAKVVDILPCVDNQVRRVGVQPASNLPSTDKRYKAYTVRAANMLVPLELNSEI